MRRHSLNYSWHHVDLSNDRHVKQAVISRSRWVRQSWDASVCFRGAKVRMGCICFPAMLPGLDSGCGRLVGHQPRTHLDYMCAANIFRERASRIGEWWTLALLTTNASCVLRLIRCQVPRRYVCLKFKPDRFTCLLLNKHLLLKYLIFR